MNTLLLLAEASWRALVTFFASVLLTGVVERHRRGDPWQWLDVPLLLGGGAALAWVVREIVQPRWTTSALRKFEKWRVPTTSGVSFVWDVALMSLGASLWNVFGPMMLFVPAGVAVARVAFWRRRPTAN